MTHRGSGRGPHVAELASHLDAADAARAVALRRDRLVARQRRGYEPTRQAEIDMLGEVWRLYRAFEQERIARRSFYAADGWADDPEDQA